VENQIGLPPIQRFSDGGGARVLAFAEKRQRTATGAGLLNGLIGLWFESFRELFARGVTVA
jgi:hypothetical protein